MIRSAGFDSYDLMTGDVNGDDAPDLVGAAGGPIWTMLNDGTGKFGSQIYDFSNDLSGLELALGRFDGDGNLDVATVDASGGHVFVGLGQGNGHFTPAAPIGPIGPQTNWVAAGDVTGDGVTDLIADLDSNAAAVLIGDGTGSFPKRSSWVTGSEGLTVADLNGAGPMDLVTFTSDPGAVHATVAVKKGMKAGRLVHGGSPQVAADLNGDGSLDNIRGGVTITEPGVLQSQILAQLNKGSGRFGTPVVSKIRVETAASGVGAIEAADINEDGVLDVVGGFSNFQPSPSNLFWMIGKGNGRFGKPTLSTTGDTNADGVARPGGRQCGRTHRHRGAHALPTVDPPGQGRRQVRPADPVRLQRAVPGGDHGGRLHRRRDARHGDGAPDRERGLRLRRFYLQQGHGDATFTRIQTRSVDSNLGQADVSDLNGDGRPDVATLGSAGFDGGRNAMWILLTTAQGQLGVPAPYAGPSGGLGVADYNGDGAPDIAVSRNNTIQIYANAGDGTFPTISSILAAGGVALGADFTGDGAPDIAGTSGVWGGSFALYVNAPYIDTSR